jgi:YHS domain-containing protein
MTDVDTLIRRIDQELKADVERDKAGWQERLRDAGERKLRLERYEAVAGHITELLKPRLAAFIERFKPVVKTEPQVREHTRALKMTFASTLAKVALLFEGFPDPDVRHVRLECTLDIVPVVVAYDRHSAVEFPLDAVPDDAVVRWFDERIVAFVKAYLAVIRRDAALRESLKEQLVEDPVAHVYFPPYLAASTLERDGQTYYFLDEDTRRVFENQQAAQE